MTKPTKQDRICHKCFAVGGHQMDCPEICIDPSKQKQNKPVNKLHK